MAFSSSELLLPPPCPDCGADGAIHSGTIPSTNVFCGVKLPELIAGGELWQCRACYLSFRSPAPSKRQLDNLYQQVTATLWSGAHLERNDVAVVRKKLKTGLPHKLRILDVGCYDGAFLASLSDEYEKYGIEINPEASEIATGRGIKVIGNDFDAIVRSDLRFDLITAIDVIEHTTSPRTFIQQLACKLRPGGTIVVSTGNTDAPAWRLMGSRYWYCALPEHISFINPRWLEHTCDAIGLELVDVDYFSHSSHRTAKYASELVLNSLYRFAPVVFRQLRRNGFGGLGANQFDEMADYPPTWQQAKDHLVAEIRKH